MSDCGIQGGLSMGESMIRRYLHGIAGTALLISTVGLAAAHAQGANCSRTSAGFIPLMDLTNGDYQGKQGGSTRRGATPARRPMMRLPG